MWREPFVPLLTAIEIVFEIAVLFIAQENAGSAPSKQRTKSLSSRDVMVKSLLFVPAG
jgi:hypothetical protein